MVDIDSKSRPSVPITHLLMVLKLIIWILKCGSAGRHTVKTSRRFVGSSNQRGVDVGHHHGRALVAEEWLQARDLVVKLVVAERHRVEVEEVVEEGDDPPLELRVPDRALVEVPRVEPHHIILLPLDILHCLAQPCQPSVTFPSILEGSLLQFIT